MSSGDTFPNAVIGALVTIVSSPIVGPVAPVIGGALSGYLEGRDGEAGLKVGLLSGLLAIIPLLVVVVLIGNLFFFVFAAGPPGSSFFGGFGLVALISAFVGMFAYVVVLSGAGGWAGAYLKRETDLGT